MFSVNLKEDTVFSKKINLPKENELFQIFLMLSNTNTLEIRETL